MPRHRHIRHTGILLVALGALLLAACGRAEFAVAGRVLDGATGQPLAGAQVALGRRGVQADPEGLFSLPLKGGSHRLQASLPGYVTQAFTATVSSEVPLLETDVLLARRTLSGAVTDAQTGAPVAGARLELAVSEAQQAESGPDGTFTVDAVHLGDLWVSAPGYLPGGVSQAEVEAAFDRTGAATSPVAVALTPRALSGTVTAAGSGAPLAGVSVACPLAATQTDEAGQYTLLYVEPGAPVTFGGAEHRTVEIVYAEQPTLDAALEPWEVALRVTDAGGAPLAGVTIQAGEQTAETDASGAAVLRGVTPETPIAVRLDGYREVPLTYAGERELAVTLERSRLAGRLTRASDGAPVANGLVQAFAAGSTEPLLVRSDADGHYVLEDAGDVVSITVKAPGYARVSQPVTDMLAADVALEPFVFRGVYIPFGLLPLPDTVYGILDLVQETGMNGVVVDVKGDWARIAWDSPNPVAQEIEAYSPYGMDLRELVEECHRRGIYIIGRIVVFKDELLGKTKPEWAVKRADGSLYTDYEGLAWVDPFRQEVRDYNIALAVEVAELGFDEVQLDYLRFPSDGAGVLHLLYGEDAVEADFDTRTAAMAEFCAQIYAAMERTPAFLSADIFGLTPFVDASRDMGIGQRVEDIAPSMDYVSPMAYPTTYAPGTLGFPDPGREPYQFVYRTVHALRQRTGTIVRPWLQYYSIGGIYYGTFEFLEQRKAAEDAGAQGWIWWNARGQYEPDAFYPDAVANTPGLSSPPPMD